MPMYYPDLKSVQECARIMQQHEGHKQYKGLFPETEQQLPVARRQLGQYFRHVWNDEIQALEVESAATEDNYEEKVGWQTVLERMLHGDAS